MMRKSTYFLTFFTLLAGMLSCSPTIPQEIKDEYLRIAKGVGYDTERLLWVEHTAKN